MTTHQKNPVESLREEWKNSEKYNYLIENISVLDKVDLLSLADWFEAKLSSHHDQLLAEILEEMPKEKDITLNEVGTVGDYHTHGFNEYHDKVRSILLAKKKEV